MKIMILSYYLFEAQWWFGIWDLELKVGINSRKIFAQEISFYIFSKEFHIGNPESYTLTSARILGKNSSNKFSMNSSQF